MNNKLGRPTKGNEKHCKRGTMVLSDDAYEFMKKQADNNETSYQTTLDLIHTIIGNQLIDIPDSIPPAGEHSVSYSVDFSKKARHVSKDKGYSSLREMNELIVRDDLLHNIRFSNIKGEEFNVESLDGIRWFKEYETFAFFMNRCVLPKGSERQVYAPDSKKKDRPHYYSNDLEGWFFVEGQSEVVIH